jgi:hypothetical protein
MSHVTVLSAEPEKLESRSSGIHHVPRVQLLDEPPQFAEPMPSPAAAPRGRVPIHFPDANAKGEIVVIVLQLWERSWLV